MLSPDELPNRLIGFIEGRFRVFEPGAPGSPPVDHFDIASYTWGSKVIPYNPSERGIIEGVPWKVKLSEHRLADIKELIRASAEKFNTLPCDIGGRDCRTCKIGQFMWVDAVCLNQEEGEEQSQEIVKMHQYYQSARMCHVLVHMPEIWNPLEIVDDLAFIANVMSHVSGSQIASTINLGQSDLQRLHQWENAEWRFPIRKDKVRSTALNMGILNCYSTAIGHIASLFRNNYFNRLWTFQELLLGQNITVWAMTEGRTQGTETAIACIGAFDTWMNLAIDSQDKAISLLDWIKASRSIDKIPANINAVIRIIEEDCIRLEVLQVQVQGIASARTDIATGGPAWWIDNYKGISNIFSAISMRPRECEYKKDIFRGLLGVFNGLFSPQQADEQLDGDDIERLSFAFFKQLSLRTGYAWTKLAITNDVRGEWDWIPVISQNETILTTDCYSGVINLGRLDEMKARTQAITGIVGSPRKYLNIKLRHEADRGYKFIFKGCNCGKKISTGLLKSKPIPTYDNPITVLNNQTGRILVECATMLGSILDPGCNVITYRTRFLRKLRPNWRILDPSAKLADWIKRCANGDWENPGMLRTHNMSMHYILKDITDCGSPLENKSTSTLMCDVRINCGCVLSAPFSWIFEALTAIAGSSLGASSAEIDEETDRITYQDGVGLVQVGDVGKSFEMVAFGGDVNANESYAKICRDTREDKFAEPKGSWPSGRALVRSEFSHGLMDSARRYGYVETNGSGNLLICSKFIGADYKILGVCIDGSIATNKGQRAVTMK